MQNSKSQLKQRAHIHTLKITKLIGSLSKGQSCKIIVAQLLRSATSIGVNIIESQALSTKNILPTSLIIL